MAYINDYSNQLEICEKSPNLKICIDHIEKLHAIFYFTLHPLRYHQEVSMWDLDTNLQEYKLNKKNLQYMLTFIFIGLVFLTMIILIPVFYCLLKEKSRVLSTFAGITDEEIKGLILEAARIDIKKVKYKQKWIYQCDGLQDKFYDKILANNKLEQTDNINISKKDDELNNEIYNAETIKDDEKKESLAQIE